MQLNEQSKSETSVQRGPALCSVQKSVLASISTYLQVHVERSGIIHRQGLFSPRSGVLGGGEERRNFTFHIPLFYIV